MGGRAWGVVKRLPPTSHSPLPNIEFTDFKDTLEKSLDEIAALLIKFPKIDFDFLESSLPLTSALSIY